MADDTQTEGAEEAPKKSKKMLIIIIIALVVVLLGAGTAFFFLTGSPDGEEELAEEIIVPAVYTKIRTKNGRPMFVATLLSSRDAAHYMQAFVVAKSRDPLVAPALDKHMPLIVSRLNTLFSSSEFSTLSTIEGKQQLRADATKLLQDIMLQRIQMKGVEEVLFTNFVMQ